MLREIELSELGLPSEKAPEGVREITLEQLGLPSEKAPPAVDPNLPSQQFFQKHDYVPILGLDGSPTRDVGSYKLPGARPAAPEPDLSRRSPIELSGGAAAAGVDPAAIKVNPEEASIVGPYSFQDLRRLNARFNPVDEDPGAAAQLLQDRMNELETGRPREAYSVAVEEPMARYNETGDKEALAEAQAAIRIYKEREKAIAKERKAMQDSGLNPDLPGAPQRWVAEKRAAAQRNPLANLADSEATGVEKAVDTALGALGSGLQDMSGMAGSLGGGLADASLGALEIVAGGITGKTDPLGTNPEARKSLRQFDELINKQNDAQSILGGYYMERLREGAYSAGFRIPSLVAAAATRNPAIGWALYGSTMGAHAYKTAKDHGFSEAGAIGYGITSAGIEVASEWAGAKGAKLLGMPDLETLVAGRNTGKGMLLNWLLQAPQEGGEEVLAGFLQAKADVWSGLDKDAYNKYMSGGWVDQGITGALAGLMLGGPAHVVNGAQIADNAERVRAEVRAKQEQFEQEMRARQFPDGTQPLLPPEEGLPGQELEDQLDRAEGLARHIQKVSAPKEEDDKGSALRHQEMQVWNTLRQRGKTRESWNEDMAQGMPETPGEWGEYLNEELGKLPQEPGPQGEAAPEPGEVEPIEDSGRRVYRDMSASELSTMLEPNVGSGETFGGQERFWADNPDLAISQSKGDSGFVVELDPAGMQLQEHAKPGTQAPGVGREYTTQNRAAEFRDRIKSVEIKPHAGGPRGMLVRVKRFLEREVQAGRWERRDIAGGGRIYSRTGQSGSQRANLDDPTPQPEAEPEVTTDEPEELTGVSQPEPGELVQVMRPDSEGNLQPQFARPRRVVDVNEDGAAIEGYEKEGRFPLEELVVVEAEESLPVEAEETAPEPVASEPTPEPVAAPRPLKPASTAEPEPIAKPPERWGTAHFGDARQDQIRDEVNDVIGQGSRVTLEANDDFYEVIEIQEDGGILTNEGVRATVEDIRRRNAAFLVQAEKIAPPPTAEVEPPRKPTEKPTKKRAAKKKPTKKGTLSEFDKVQERVKAFRKAIRGKARLTTADRNWLDMTKDVHPETGKPLVDAKTANIILDGLEKTYLGGERSTSELSETSNVSLGPRPQKDPRIHVGPGEMGQADRPASASPESEPVRRTLKSGGKVVPDAPPTTKKGWLDRLKAKYEDWTGKKLPRSDEQVTNWLYENLARLKNGHKLPVLTGRSRKFSRDKDGKRRVQGFYNWINGTIRVANPMATDILVHTHEIWHHIDDLYDVTGSSRDPLNPKTKLKTGKTDMSKDEMASAIRNSYEYSEKNDYSNPAQVRLSLQEGTAEYFRMYVTEPNLGAVKDSSRAYAQYFDRLLNENPELKAYVEEAREVIRALADLPAVERATAAIADTKGQEELGDRMRHLLHNQASEAMRQWVDHSYELKIIEGEMKEIGLPNRPHETFLMYSVMAPEKARRAIVQAVERIDNAEVIGEPLQEARKWLKTESEEGEAISYAQALHAVWFHENKKPNYGAGIPLREAYDIVQYYDNAPDQDGELKGERYKKFARHISDFGDSLLTMLASGGVISQEQADRMIEYYDGHYFPLIRDRERSFSDSLRVMSGHRGYVNLPNPFPGRSMEGVGKDVADPFTVMIERALAAYGRASKHRAMLDLLTGLDPEMYGAAHLGRHAVRVTPNMQQFTANIEEMLGQLSKKTRDKEGRERPAVIDPRDARAMLFAWRVLHASDGDGDHSLTYEIAKNRAAAEEFSERHGIKPSDDSNDPAWQAQLQEAALREPDAMAEVAMWRSAYEPSARERVVVFHHKGEPIMYQLSDELYRLLTRMDEVQLTGLMHTAKKTSNIFKKLSVGVNLQFMLFNGTADLWTSQGRAEDLEGWDSMTRPVQLGILNLKHKLYQMTNGKMGQKSPGLVEAWEDIGGDLYNMIAEGSSRQRFRKNMLRPEDARLTKYEDAKDKVLWAWNFVQEMVAASDAPARLAAGEAALRKEGYEFREEDNAWFRNDEKIGVLDENGRRVLATAGANATVDFRPKGVRSARFEAVLPYTQATINAFRQWYTIEKKYFGDIKQAKKDGKILSPGEWTALMKRRSAYHAAMVGISATAALLRSDDDDYLEQPEWFRSKYWSIGWGGKTRITIPKPRDEAFFYNYVEGLVRWAMIPYEGQPSFVGPTLMQDVLEKFPMGGGWARGALEYAVGYDFWRGQYITPDHIERSKFPQDQHTPYTTMSARWFGGYTGAAIGVSPLEIDHLFNAASGGAWRRWVGTMEDLLFSEDDRDGWFYISKTPFKQFMPDRHQAVSIANFYEELTHAERMYGWQKDNGEPVDRAAAQRKLHRLKRYANLMTNLRDHDKKDLRGRRTDNYISLLVGISREGMERGEMPFNESPFSYDEERLKELPPLMLKKLKDFAEREAEVAILSHGRPSKVSEEETAEGLTLDAKLADWEAKRASSEQWLREHMDSPLVRDAIQEVRGTNSYRNLMRNRGMPSDPRERLRYREKQRQAARMRRELLAPAQ